MAAAATSRVRGRTAVATAVRSAGHGFFLLLLDVIRVRLGLIVGIPGVHARMPAHVALDTEATPTAFVRADVRFLARVRVHMNLQARRPGEPFPTPSAFVPAIRAGVAVKHRRIVGVLLALRVGREWL